jgi:hypothetical protein
MYLATTSHHGKSFNELLSLAQTGDRIFLGPRNDPQETNLELKASRNGIVFRIHERFFDIANDRKLYDGPQLSWYPLGDGLAFQDEDGRIMYASGNEDPRIILQSTAGFGWRAGTDGIFVTKGDLIDHVSLGGVRTKVYEGEHLQPSDWQPAVDGIIAIIAGKRPSFSHFSLDGKKTEILRVTGETYWEYWRPHPLGVVTLIENTGIYLHPRGGKEQVLPGCGSDDAYTGCRIYYAPGLLGVILDLKGMLYLVVHKG